MMTFYSPHFQSMFTLQNGQLIAYKFDQSLPMGYDPNGKGKIIDFDDFEGERRELLNIIIERLKEMQSSINKN